ncbi:hypothetical protein Q8W71_04625 [Methylobacterium sp. NEAU 140]|uniref:hypothetical protein n=1 Tax=Methylobacterium sp. NEAU 140 TaxID=3064945 RepID=UPI002733435B|nr:hypothetical protein [Methylobacterium sp. NEAU 140]MDP4021902.1 hypothetical protein [Methylobacterium sp. NEAU 140]
MTGLDPSGISRIRRGELTETALAVIPDREIEESPLGGRITRDGCTVTVHIVRFADSDDERTLEVVDHDGGSTVWTAHVQHDHDACEAFEQAATADGMASLSDDGPVRH